MTTTLILALRDNSPNGVLPELDPPPMAPARQAAFAWDISSP
jgi:hypothetical protein